MKIGFIVDKCAPFYLGGYENRYWNIASRLASKHEVRIYTSIPGEEAWVEGVHFVRSNLPAPLHLERGSRSLRHSLRFAFSLVRCPLDGWNPDALIVEAIPYLQLLTSAVWIRNLRARVVLNLNEAWFNYRYLPGLFSRPTRAFIKYLIRLGLARSDGVVAISSATAQSIKENFRDARVVVIPMGIDRSVLEPRSQASQQADRSFDVVSIGRLVPIKHHSDLLSALAILRDEYRWSGRAMIIGEGPSRVELEGRSEALGLGSQVLMPGKVSDFVKFQVLRTSKVFVLCSEREGFSLATLEAMASGAVPIVARPALDEVYGVGDLVEDGVTGMAYPSAEPRELARRLRSLLADERRLAALSAGALTRAAGYDWDHVVGTFEKYLLNLVQVGAGSVSVHGD